MKATRPFSISLEAKRQQEIRSPTIAINLPIDTSLSVIDPR
jgi:hypothetical protein